MFTVLWCYLRNTAFKKDDVDYHVAADLTGQANHLGVTIEADIIKQKLPENNGGYNAFEGYGKTNKLVYDELTTDHPIDLSRWQVANCYMGRIGLINTGGESKGAGDLAEAVRTAVINKRAGGIGPDLGPQGVPAPDGRGRRAAQRHPGRLPRRRRSPSPDRRRPRRATRPGPCAPVRRRRARSGRRQRCHAARHRRVTSDRHRPAAITRRAEALDRVVIRFAGDSGDGMQLTGDRFTSASALFGNDLSTLPDFPAEIRAPAGTLAGVSAFQVHISDHDITTPGDAPNVLVAMNPAALKADLDAARAGRHAASSTPTPSTSATSTKAGYAANPLDDGSLDGYTVFEVPMTSAHQGGGRRRSASSPATPSGRRTSSPSASSRGCTPGPVEPTLDWIDERFAATPQVRDANTRRLQGRPRLRRDGRAVRPPLRGPARPTLPPGTYTNITGNTALAWGLVAAGQLAKLPLFLGSYPITPASDILHELSKHKNFGVRTLQAEDEIAGIGAALGAAFAGHLGVTTTSGPGVALKAETIGLAVSLELPLLIIDIQRGGPVDRPADQDRGGRPAAWRCTAATARRRCRSSPPTARRTASTPRSRRPASRSSTARR